ncbi:MAG TPA: hypothetical protein VMA13_03285 [Candidatus Saccharimonadales bacterium]|nr:hypothetical protein [Candidatus Saccharimonadales bacterium]
MQSGSIRKWLLALTLLAVILWTIVHFYNQSAQNSGNITRIIVEPGGDFAYHKTNSSAAKPQESAAGAEKNPRQSVEDWLTLNHRSAASLLAAFHVLDDTNYLTEAATNFPDNPQVEWTILARNVFPADRRRWLELFKTSSPSNSLPDYLSAQAYFRNSQPEAAVKDLVAATDKPDFETYTVESQLDTEELCQFLGKSTLAASESVSSPMGDLLQTLATIKQLASQMTDLQKQELNAGDTASAENLAQMGTILGDQLDSDDNGKYIVNQLAGTDIETLVLQQLDPNTSCDFLDGETPAQRLQELRQQSSVLAQLDKSFDALEPSLTDAEKISFEERTKIYGEITAMRWLLQLHGNPQNGQ